ncbi:MAG: hypothetical protein R3F55_11705 [Alphaproteobacteria bacterium]
MLRFLIRLLALPFLVAALATLAAAVYMIVQGVDVSLPAGQVWTELDSPSLNLAEAIVDRYVAPNVFYPDLWYDAVVPLLGWPAWQAVLAVMFGAAVIGLILWRLGGIGRRRPVD